MPAWQQHGIAIGRHGSGGCGSGAGVAVAGVSSAGESSAGESSAGVQRRGNGGVAAVAWQLVAWQPLGSASGGCIAFGAAGNTSLFHVRPCDDHGHAARRMLGYTPGSTVESGETARDLRATRPGGLCAYGRAGSRPPAPGARTRRDLHPLGLPASRFTNNASQDHNTRARGVERRRSRHSPLTCPRASGFR